MKDSTEDLTNQEYLQIICDSSNNLLTLAKNLLDNFKLELNQFNIQKKLVYIPTFIQKYQLSFKKLKLINIFDGYLLFDDIRIDQVIYNLLSNASDFSNNITLNIIKEKVTNYIIFSIKDDGIGISIEKQNLLFKRFSENVNSHIKRKNPRTGLGLYICKSIINLHNGKIWLEPSTKGCDFRFSLPIE